jgi:anti-sigma factor RsiW
MMCEDVERLVEAYADGELALETALILESHMEQCAACRSRIDRVRAIKQSLLAAPYFRTPESLAARVRAAADMSATPVRSAPQARRPRLRRLQPWLASAASLAVVSFAVAMVLHQRAAAADAMTAEAVIEGHVRSLMGDHLTDVASTDRHTVKPWFAGRVDFSPAVVDLAGEGFPLIGGRLDYIDHHAVAALVYKRREHTINVFVWPSSNGSPSHAARSDPRGYHVISWSRGGRAVWVVSDLALGELEDFTRRLDAAIQE